MMRRRTKRRVKKNTGGSHGSEITSRDKLEGIFILAGAIIVSVGVAFWLFFPELFSGVASKTMPVENRMLDHPLVCMVSNSFKGQQQIPVPVNGRIYYGCCRKCVVKLQHNPGLRYSTDALTGRNIDKAKAVITYDPEGYPAVLYFETKANAENYLEVDLTERIHKTGQTPDTSKP